MICYVNPLLLRMDFLTDMHLDLVPRAHLSLLCFLFLYEFHFHFEVFIGGSREGLQMEKQGSEIVQRDRLVHIKLSTLRSKVYSFIMVFVGDLRQVFD